MGVAGFVGFGLCAALALAWVQCRTWMVVARFNPALAALALVADAVIWVGTGLVAIPFGFLGWKLWLFWAAVRWEPVGGLFAPPRWPRNPIGRGGHVERGLWFREPLPWTRGPFTY